ncbi:MAG: hypothetical protein IPK80_15840 [Nannocystis sp.]|nr:hypothetical protein [Nannocystis sp.]
MAYIKQVEAIERTLTLRRRRLEEQSKTPGGRDKMTERQLALLEHGTRAWVEELLALPEGWEYDPGVAWDEIGIDMLVVDEAASFKNLYLPQPREDGGIPKFMGGSGDGSNRAWQLDFRAAMVRRQTGGAGGRPAHCNPRQESPLELYNLIQFIDPTAFYSAGIYDPEQFIDRFIKIELRDVLTSDFKIESASAVTGFRNLDDLRTIIFSKSEFRSAAEVGLQLPRPIVETVTVAMDELQEAKYDKYVREIERILAEPAKPDSGGPSNVIVGLLARLSLVALHSGLDEGYNLKNALDGGVATRNVYDPRTGEVEEITVTLPRPIYESPSFTACAERIVASPHCGHIIFVEPTAVHMWMREVLVANGIPRERIAILNSEVSTSERATIAREFNGLGSAPAKPGACARPSDFATAPKYDIVIANSVAYEGIDLQVRTCAIHHVDLTWTPADLEQRNGRGVRQGNTLGLINIYYYFADGSTDGYRFSLIDGKAGWLGQLLTSAVRDTNNPGAQQQLSPEDVLIAISRDKEKTRALIEMKRSQAIEAARARIAREANRVLRQAVSRFDRAREADDPEHAARLREDAEQRLSDLKTVDPAAWPWYPWIHVARDVDMLVPELGAPVYEGLRITRPRVGDTSQLDHFEFGAITDASGPKVGLRLAGSATWQLLTYEGDLAGKPLDPADFRAKAARSGPSTTKTAPPPPSPSSSETPASCAASTISAGSAPAMLSSPSGGPVSTTRSPKPSQTPGNPPPSPSSTARASPSPPEPKYAAPACSHPPSKAGASTSRSPPPAASPTQPSASSASPGGAARSPSACSLTPQTRTTQTTPRTTPTTPTSPHRPPRPHRHPRAPRPRRAPPSRPRPPPPRPPRPLHAQPPSPPLRPHPLPRQSSTTRRARRRKRARSSL